MTRSLTATGLGLSYGDRVVLRGIDLRLEPGRLTALVGSNGSGKSSLMMALAGLSPEASGEVRLGDAPVRRMSHRERARRIGLLPQLQEVAWALDVETVVELGRTPHLATFGPSPADREATRKAMQEAGVLDLAGRQIGALSGGERERVLLARALAGEPEWLLADEPLTGLDPRHQLESLALLKRLAADEGRGVLVSLHDLTLAARWADRVILLHRGAVLADGPPAEVLQPEPLTQAFGVESRWTPGPHGPFIDIIAPLRGEEEQGST